MNPTDGKPAAQGAAPEHPVAGPPPRRIDLSRQELETILAHAKAALSEAEFTTLQGALETLAYLTTELEKKHVSLQRLRQMLFGATTETTAQVLQQILEHAGKELTPEADANAAAGTTEPGTAEKPKGHGRHGADAYRGAKTIHVPLATLKAGDACPCCVKGRVYASCGPGLIVRLTGQAPIGGTVYELEKLRCGLCGEVFSAPAPAGVGEEKYDPESAAMIALLKYGTGLPFHRLERLQEGLGIPLPAATQWEIVEETAGILAPALAEMIHHAAQGQILHNDDSASSQGWRVQWDIKPTGVRARSSVARMAGRREINDLKPIDKAIFRMVSKRPGRNASERTSDPEIVKTLVAESPVVG
jgi:transposase